MNDEELMKRIQILEEKIQSIENGTIPARAEVIVGAGFKPAPTNADKSFIHKLFNIFIQNKYILLSIIFIPFGILLAASVTKPHTFSAGDKVSASKVNENFDALFTKVNDLDTRMTAMESSTTGKSWRLIYEKDVTAATQTVDITGLNGDVDVKYELVIRSVSSTASLFIINPNGDSNTGNYSTLGMSSNGGAAGGDTTNYGGIVIGQSASVGNLLQSHIFIYSKSGQRRIFYALTLQGVTSSQYVCANAGTWLDTGSNITSLTIKSVTGNGIGAGTHIELWARR